MIYSPEIQIHKQHPSSPSRRIRPPLAPSFFSALLKSNSDVFIFKSVQYYIWGYDMGPVAPVEFRMGTCFPEEFTFFQSS